ncbi:hypothetical protein ACFQE4_25010 [Streptomyces thermocoprophilus]
MSSETRSKTSERSREAISAPPHDTVPLCGSIRPDNTFISVLVEAGIRP